METKPFNDHSFNEFLEQQQLMGSRCEDCNTLYCPPRAFCPNCGGTNMVWHQFKGNGNLAAFTCITVCAPHMIALGYGRDNPYCVGVVQLDEGPKIDARIIGVDAKKPETIHIGTKMTIQYQEAKTANDTSMMEFHPAV